MTPESQALPSFRSQRVDVARAQRELAQHRVDLAEARAAYRREQLRAELARAHGLDHPDKDLRFYEHRLQAAHLRVLQGELALARLDPASA